MAEFLVEDCIFFMLAKASQAGSRFWTANLTELNLTAAQAMVLNFLGLEDAISSKALAERTGLDGATLTGILDRLEQTGLVCRLRHLKDRRAIQICLTDDGSALLPHLRKKLDEANRNFLAGLSDKEQKDLRRLLRAVRNNASPQNRNKGDKTWKTI